jgi:hypothetical protein
VIQSDAVETCEEIARLALDDALLRITERYGTSLESLALGRRAPGDPRPRRAGRSRASASS